MTVSGAPQAFSLPGYTVLPEPKLRFGSPNANDVDIHPLKGLLRFGPYSRGKIAALPDTVRVAAIVPAGYSNRIPTLLRELEQKHQPRERKPYLPEFTGFSKVFHVRLVSDPRTIIELPQTLSDSIKGADRPHVVLADALTRALAALRNQRLDFDVALLVLSKEWEAASEAGTKEVSIFMTTLNP